MFDLLLADGIAIAAFQFAEHNCGEYRQSAQHKKRAVNSVDDFRRTRMKPVGNKYAVTSEAVATPKLIDICCMVLAMRAGAADLLVRHIRIDQRVHAGVLQRSKKSVAEQLQHDQPDRRAHADCREQ